VRTQSLRLGNVDGPARTITEYHRFGGKVAGPDGEPLKDVWVTVPELGLWAASSPEGHFRFDKVPAGSFELQARTIGGDQVSARFDVPGTHVDLVIGQEIGKKPAKKGG
jgi:hypothetical protein